MLMSKPLETGTSTTWLYTDWWCITLQQLFF